jgi:hypothetical protein
MKSNLFAGIVTLGLAWAAQAPAQPMPLYTVPQGVQEPLYPIDAVSVFVPSGATFIGEAAWPELFQTSDTLNYTNQGTMLLLPGGDFETFPASTASYTQHMAANFINDGNSPFNGTVSFSEGTWSPYNLYGPGRLIIAATNIVNSGVIDCGETIDQFVGIIGATNNGSGTNTITSYTAAGLISLTGGDVNLSYGTLRTPTPSDEPDFLTYGMLDEYWGLGRETNGMVPAELLPFGDIAEAPMALVTDRTYQPPQPYFVPVELFNPTTYVSVVPDPFQPIGNTDYQVVMVANDNTNFNLSVYFQPGQEILVQWEWQTTNPFTGALRTNYLALQDTFASRFLPDATNFYFVPDGEVIPQAGSGIMSGGYPRPTYIPVNYTFSGLSSSLTNLFTGAQPGSATGILDGNLVTNDYAAYEAVFSTSGQLLQDLPGANVTNLAGRVEVTAANSLDLTQSRISAMAYVLLKATNAFLGSQGAQISAPNVDLWLRTTNGLMAVSNLTASYLPYPTGTIGLWSARWTNIFTNAGGQTNLYHVLFVNSSLSALTAPMVQTLNLTVTNTAACRSRGDLVISDVLTVSSNILLDARSLTVTTNAASAAAPTGVLEVMNPNLTWPGITSGLEALTNWGMIFFDNSADFAQGPFDPYAATQVPYLAFVNHGLIEDGGSHIWASYFENGGQILTSPLGSMELNGAGCAILTNGSIQATLANLSLNADNLVISNHVLAAGNTLSLGATNGLSDGVANLAWLDALEMASQLPGATPYTLSNYNLSGLTHSNLFSATLPGTNNWTCSGLALPVMPAQGDLLGTTITCTAQSNQVSRIFWAAADRGTNDVGYLNNAAVGHLILNGLDQYSRFAFSGPNGTNALYVDCLELQGAAGTNIGTDNQYLALADIPPNMTVYFARALGNGAPIDEHLNDYSQGRVVWVKNYNYGYFSSTNLFNGFTNGFPITNRVNAAMYYWHLGTQEPYPDTTLWLSVTNDVPAVPDVPIFWANPVTLNNAVEGVFYSNTVAGWAIDPPSGSALTFTAMGLPNGLTLGTNGTLYGTPTSASTNSFVVQAATAGGAVATATVNLAVAATNTTPTNSVSLTNSDNVARLEVPPTPAPGGKASGSAGIFYGLFADTNGVAVESAGSIIAQTTARSNFTASVLLGGKTYSLSGRFEPATGIGTNKPVRLKSGGYLNASLSLTTNDQMVGTLSSGTNWSAEVIADRLVWGNGKPAPAANYTFVIPPQTNGPAGYGFGTLAVTAGGKITWKGVMGDGSTVSQSSALSGDDYWPLFASLYGGEGLAITWVQVGSNGLASDGDLIWLKPAGATEKNFAASFTNTVGAAGSVYSQPAASVLAHAQLAFSGGGLTEPFTNSLGLDSRFHLVHPATNELSLSFTASSGMFDGQLVIPSAGKVSFQGVWLAGTNAGFGYFLNKNQVGQVELIPVE